MLRSACRPHWADVPFALPPKLLAVGLGVVMAACSADVTRLDAPMFGLTGGSGNRTAAAPIPQESVWASSSPRAPTANGYGQNYRTPSRQHYAAAPRAQGRPVTPYAPADSGRSGSSYQPAPSQPTYRAPSYRTSYEAPARQPDVYQGRTPTPPRQPAYGSQPQRRVAALPPQQTREPARSTPTSRPVTRSAPAQAVDRPAPARTTRAATAPEIEVQPGDTLYGLAERHDVSISQLMTMNGLTSPVLRPGQRLMLPKGARMIADSGRQSDRSASTPRTALAEPSFQPEPEINAPDRPATNDTTAFEQDGATYESAGTYTIRRGESLYSIAVREGVSLAELQRINDIDDPRKVRAGTVLRLPSPSSTVETASETQSPPRAVAEIEATPRSQPKPAAAPAPETSSDPAQPVIINRPQRVASLEEPETVSDALPPAAAPPSAVEPAPAPDHSTAVEKAKGIGKFRWPVRGRVIAGFGKHADGSRSDGIKLAVPVGTEVHAAETGVVAFADDVLKDYGNLILLRHDDGWISAYAHNDELLVKRGDRVRRGQVIAKAGKTGNAETPQLHFELRKGSSPVDPIPHLEKL